MSTIVRIHAREILDSRGNTAVEVDVPREDGSMGWAAVPSGDGDGALRGDKGVLEALTAVYGETAEAPIAVDTTGRSGRWCRSRASAMTDTAAPPTVCAVAREAEPPTVLRICK